MGAEIPIWVEVEVIERVWVKSYGVTSSEAVENAKSEGHRVTGRASYEQPKEDV